MKRILIIIIIILLILTNYKINEKEVFDENYDIIYKKDEVGITFILENDINALLINNNDSTDILIAFFLLLKVVYTDCRYFENIENCRMKDKITHKPLHRDNIVHVLMCFFSGFFLRTCL